MVVFDTSAVLLALDPKAASSVNDGAVRVKHLLNELEDRGEKVLIPANVLSELLVGAGDATTEWLEIFRNSAVFRIVSFDQKAAIEAAILHQKALTRGPTQKGVTKTKLKFDRMIVAIALAEGADTIYSDDNGLLKDADEAGLKAVRISDLPLPPQGELEL